MTTREVPVQVVERRTVVPTWAWIAVVVVGSVVASTYLVLPPRGREVTFVAVAVGAALVLLVTARRRSRRRFGWWALAVAVACLALGDVVFVAQGASAPPRPPSWGDVPYLVGMLGLSVGVFALGRDPDRTAASESALDVAVLSLAGGLVVWSIVGEEAIERAVPGAVGYLVAAAYPAADLVLLATVASLLLSRRTWSRPLQLLVVAVSAQLLADFAFGLDRDAGLYAEGGLPDVGWLVVYIAAAAAALHPASSDIGRPGSGADRAGISHWRVLVLWLAFLGPTVGAVAIVAPQVASEPQRAFAQLVAAGFATALMASLVLFRLSRTAATLRSALEQRRTLHQQLTHEASHDPLTGLANRRRFLDAVRVASSLGDDVTVCYFDLDHFKEVNDRHGHKAGDELLRIVGARLDRVLRDGDLAARLGGDEFAVLLEGTGPRQVDRIAERILDEVGAPVALDDDAVVDVGVSIGIARSTPDDAPDRDLVHDADIAMYAAKREGRARVSWYSEAMNVAEVTRLAMQDDVRGAVQRGELRLVYQPIVTLPERETVAVEALLRWDRPDGTAVPPDEFIAVAERVGAIVPIGSWVVREACRQLRAWDAEGIDLRVNVNVSAVQLLWTGFASDVEEALTAVGVAPERLVLEITETALLEDAVVVRPAIERLRRHGVRFAVDDFGTGYSSLRYLRDVPVDELKIDRSFVAGVDRGPEDAALALAVMHLAGSFGLRTVAEGVETEEQLAVLVERGCRLAQGYLIAPPRPPGEVAAWLAEQPEGTAPRTA